MPDSPNTDFHTVMKRFRAILDAGGYAGWEWSDMNRPNAKYALQILMRNRETGKILVFDLLPDGSLSPDPANKLDHAA